MLAFPWVAFASPPAGENAEKGKAQEKELIASSGLYLARVVSVDPKFRYLFVSPLAGDGHRMTFYLDKRTIYRQARKPVNPEKVLPGRRVGIRYIREDDIAYAEGVFLIEGEVNPRDLQMPKKKRKPAEGGAEKKEGKEKAADHGAAKKPSGGGHH